MIVTNQGYFNYTTPDMKDCQALMDRAQKLLQDASRIGVVIEMRSVPRAIEMGNNVTKVTIWPKRIQAP